MTPPYAPEDADLHFYDPAMPLIFLDVDGVLNDHRFDTRAMSSRIEADRVARLNEVLEATSARVVVSSAWRYLVHNGRMNLTGFAWLMASHGLLSGRIVGVTRQDTLVRRPRYDGVPQSWPVDDERGIQIADWRHDNGHVGPYVVLDDLDLGIEAAGHPFVRTDGSVGLAEADGLLMIAYLGTGKGR